jgi:hypothetical protein
LPRYLAGLSESNFNTPGITIFWQGVLSGVTRTVTVRDPNIDLHRLFLVAHGLLLCGSWMFAEGGKDLHKADGAMVGSHYLERLIFNCPQCGAYSNDPVKRFDIRDAIAIAPESAYVLLQCFCCTCDLEFDVARWTPALGKDSAKGSGGGAEQSLLERFHNAVNQAATSNGEAMGKAADGRIMERKGSLDADIEFLNMETNPNFEKREPIIPMPVLALARGIRMAAFQIPDRLFLCRIGRLRLVLSLDQDGDGRPCHLMHLSVSDLTFGNIPTNGEVCFAASLFLSEKESEKMYEVPPNKLQHVRHLVVPLTIKGELH